MAIKRSIVAVPARLASSRLPGKYLLTLAVSPLASKGFGAMRKANGPVDVVLCTDSEQLQQLSWDLGFPVLMILPAATHGSERIASLLIS